MESQTEQRWADVDPSLALPGLSANEVEAVLWLVLRGLQSHVRAGYRVPTWAGEACRRLAAVVDALREQAASSGSGTGLGTVGLMDLITASEAAADNHVSTSYVRRLARDGRILGHRAGHLWLVDRASARAVIGGAK